MTPPPERVPVIIATGQSINRDRVVSARDLMESASRAALDEAPGIERHIELVTVVDVLNDDHPRPATALAHRVGIPGARCETTTVGGNTPQWLVTRTAAAIASGEVRAALLAGAEALASKKKGGTSEDPDEVLRAGDPDPKVGVDRFGLGPAETGIQLYLPIHIYPMIESAIAAREGRSFGEQRDFIARFMARNTAVAAKHPYAWFPEEATPDELSSVNPENRLTADPYTLRMNAIMAVDQGAAVVVCSLAVARELGLADQAIYVWSGADTNDVWYPSQRPDLSRSPGIRAAGQAALAAAGIGIDDVDHIDLYSCFPSAIEVGAEALGIALDDARGLTVTGGLAYFGGPGNNYTMHSIATTAELLREGGGVGLCTGLGWYITKHSVGIYGAEPPPNGFVRADTSAIQQQIDSSEVPLGLDVTGPATVVANTITYERDGSPSGAPIFAEGPDGRRIAARAEPEIVEECAGRLLVGEQVEIVSSDPATYRI